MTKKYNWRIADWRDPEDFSAEEATEDCNKIKEVSAIPTEDNVIQFKQNLRELIKEIN